MPKRMTILFNWWKKYYQKALKEYWGDELPEGVIDSVRMEFEKLVPEIPSYGRGMAMFNLIIQLVAMDLALYRVLKKHSKTPEESADIGRRALELRMQKVPKIFRRIIGSLWFSKLNIKNGRNRAATLQRRQDPHGWVATFVDGDGVEFDYGVDYTECGACKFLKAQNAQELAPLLCTYDFVLSDYLNWGLRRTQTLAEGGTKCDFRFKKP